MRSVPWQPTQLERAAADSPVVVPAEGPWSDLVRFVALIGGPALPSGRYPGGAPRGYRDELGGYR
ncbi:MAG TPA: hypothetical protein VNL96_00345 [Gemmatimonadaceae bacterium]|nr:hypothetical protein [Gemmatimonadaceae bacterium]